MARVRVSPMSVRSACARPVARERIKCKIPVVALANQHPERALTCAPVSRRHGESPLQQRHGPIQFGLAGLLAQRRHDQLAVDPAPGQLTGDPLGSPLLERPLVLCEQARVASIIEVAKGAQLLDCRSCLAPG